MRVCEEQITHSKPRTEGTKSSRNTEKKGNRERGEREKDGGEGGKGKCHFPQKRKRKTRESGVKAFFPSKDIQALTGGDPAHWPRWGLREGRHGGGQEAL